MMSFLKQLFSTPEPTLKYYLTVCVIVKDEDPYLAEFINFHLKAGVEHFYIYDNQSKVRARDVIQKAGLLEHVTVTDFPGKNRLVKSYDHCLKHYGAYSKWISFLDMDEFIVAKSTQGNIPVFLKDYENYGAVVINWQLFGSGHHLKRTNRPQMESYTLKAEEDFNVNRHIKSIVQPRYVKEAANAHHFKYKKGYFAVNENFEPVQGSQADVSINKIQINHYYCRSFEEYEEKVNRGRADSSRKRSMEEFHNHDRDANVVTDTTILEIFK
jgi:hypothetical protein